MVRREEELNPNFIFILVKKTTFLFRLKTAELLLLEIRQFWANRQVFPLIYCAVPA